MSLEEQYHAEEMLRKIERVEAERDNAWTELREIRAAISANPEESTLDEVVKLRQQLANMTKERDDYMRDYGKEQDRKREVAQKLAIVTKKLELAEACLAGDGALITGLKDDLAEREKQIKLYEQALLASWPEGAKGKAFDFWNAARILATTEPKP